MPRFVTFTVETKPGPEDIYIDGIKFTHPADLWQYLQDTANGIARKAPRTSLFFDAKRLALLQEALLEYSIPPGGTRIEPRYIPAASRVLEPGKSKINPEDMGL